MARSGYEQSLIWQCKIAKLPAPTPEFRFAVPRRWRFDLAWPDRKLYAEVEGGIWKGGRHTRGKGYERDMEKYNAATLAGWRGLRFSVAQVKSGVALTVLEQAFAAPSGFGVVGVGC
jgi:hypothetical protein